LSQFSFEDLNVLQITSIVKKMCVGW